MLKTASVFLFSAILFSQSIAPQTKISGKVTDKNNISLPGANIYIKDTYDGATSDIDGNFSFNTEETGEAVLIVSYVGYKTNETSLNLDGQPKSFEIVLEEESTELGTVVISAGSFEASDENKAVILRPLDIVTTAGAQPDIYTALETLLGTQQIGGGPKTAKPYLEKSLAKFNQFKPENDLMPNWGKEMVEQFLNQVEEADTTGEK